MKFNKIISYVFFFNLSLGMGVFASAAHAANLDLMTDADEESVATRCETIRNETVTENVADTCLVTLSRCEARINETIQDIAAQEFAEARGRINPGDLVPIEDVQDFLEELSENLQRRLDQATNKFREEVVRDCQPLPQPVTPVNPPALDQENNEDAANQIVVVDDKAEGKAGCTLGAGGSGAVNYLYVLGMFLPLLGLRRK